jgi:hypothetical protein
MAEKTMIFVIQTNSLSINILKLLNHIDFFWLEPGFSALVCSSLPGGLPPYYPALNYRSGNYAQKLYHFSNASFIWKISTPFLYLDSCLNLLLKKTCLPYTPYSLRSINTPLP